MRQRRTWFALLAAVAVTGCNSKGPSIKTFPVTGSVTYNGKAVIGATVSYMTKSTDGPRSSAVTDTDGKFSLSTYVGPTEILKGAAPGDYKVTVIKQSADAQGAMADATTMESLSPEERQKMMTNMWQKQKVTSSDANRPPEAAQPKSEIPVKYAKADTTDLTATVVSGENEPREFKLTD